jgi:hypothetical protein
MRAFEVVNKNDCKDNIWGDNDCRKIIVTLLEGPYTDERILNKTGYNLESVVIKDVTLKEIK